MKSDFIDLAVRSGTDGRGDCQWGWYATFQKHLCGSVVLDVGTGLSRAKRLMAEMGAEVKTQEVAPGCPADFKCPIEDLPFKSFDVVTCFDVVEHVKEYGSFIFHLSRLARRTVIVTTPGAAITGNKSPYHWHEFQPDELCHLLEATGMLFHEGYGTPWEPPTLQGAPQGQQSMTREDFQRRNDLHPIGVVYKWKTSKESPGS